MKQPLEDKPLLKLFGSTSRARIIALLSGRPHRSLYQREIMYETGLSLQAVQRELKNLVALGILENHADRHRMYYQINPASSFYAPLKEICRRNGPQIKKNLG